MTFHRAGDAATMISRKPREQLTAQPKSSAAVLLRYCPRLRPIIDRKTGKVVYTACGRPRCSFECRDSWARKMSACVLRSARTLPPSYLIGLKVWAVIADRELTRMVCKFCRRLRKRFTAEYLAVGEWRHGVRHHHILVRTNQPLNQAMILPLWSACCPLPSRCYCKAVRSVEAVIRYIFKALKDDTKKEVVPPTFGGRVWTYSRGFLAAPVRTLWREQVEEWYAGDVKMQSQ